LAPAPSSAARGSFSHPGYAHLTAVASGVLLVIGVFLSLARDPILPSFHSAMQ
jgi:hypothetical protein